MKERPILFSAPMVRALLDGSKTQTRRIVKNRRDPNIGCDMSPGEIARDPMAACMCPYGVPGDRLWVRESWSAPHNFDAHMPFEIPADARWHYAATEERGGLRWRPSIHMPRVASRITLELTEVRVERLQDISESDAEAEGAEPLLVPPDGGSRPHVEGFRSIWDSINGPDSWAADPWVWVVSFRLAA